MGVQGPNKQKNKYLRLTEQPELPQLLPKCSIVSLSLSCESGGEVMIIHLPCPAPVARLRICSRTFLVREAKRKEGTTAITYSDSAASQPSVRQYWRRAPACPSHHNAKTVLLPPSLHLAT